MKISQILGFSLRGSRTSAHETHLKTISYSESGTAKHVIFKRNKHLGELGEKASTLEAAFTAVANAYAAPHRALQQDIVTNPEGRVIGVCSENAAHALLRIKKAQKEVVFLQAALHFNTADEVSTDDFETWVKSHAVVSTIAPPMTPDIENNRARWAKFRQAQTSDESVEEYNKKYADRLNDYWEERKRIGELAPEAEPEVLSNCIFYAQHLLRMEQMLDLDDVPDYLIKSKDHGLLSQVFESEFLKRNCESKMADNVQTEQEIAAFGAGKGYNFLDKLPQNFFAKLLEQKKLGAIDVDIDSLADVFATAYGLEEDDLHKGNIGYYVTQENERPCFHFFKIDHDLMFSDKVMAAHSAPRFANLGYTEEQFRITSKDLQNFPDLQDSGNHYWPTKSAVFAVGDKAYHSKDDREAYKSLKDDPDFQNAKWLRFLKQSVLPNEFIVRCLKQPLEHTKTNPDEASTLNIVQRATASRICELRAALIGVPEFREYIAANHDVAQKMIMAELREHALSLGCKEQEIQGYEFGVKSAINSIILTCATSTAQTALHSAIDTQSYRCYETARYFKKCLKNTDADGLTAMDHALVKYEQSALALQQSKTNWPHHRKMLTYYADVICDLDRANAPYTLKTKQSYEASINQIQSKNSLSSLPVVKSLDDYARFLAVTRNNAMNSLKVDKMCALKLLEKADLGKEDLLKLKAALKPEEPESSLKFIKELRSEIWLVKKIRGAYGETSTVRDMRSCIDKKINELDMTEKYGIELTHIPRRTV